MSSSPSRSFYFSTIHYLSMQKYISVLVPFSGFLFFYCKPSGLVYKSEKIVLVPFSGFLFFYDNMGKVTTRINETVLVPFSGFLFFYSNSNFSCQLYWGPRPLLGVSIFLLLHSFYRQRKKTVLVPFSGFLFFYFGRLD